MGLISPGGENLLDFLELRQVLSTYDGDLRDLLWWPQERSIPMRVAQGPLGMMARPWSSSRFSSGDRLLLRCERNAGNYFPNTQGKDPSSRVETGMSGNFLSCSKGVKDPLEVPEVRCD